ncbi:MAG TPA: hypothetical protein VG759_11030 [Candidatus Angelobacter sp.]|jgi:hypothetical protein|nr:hypothetical protein [Candidatus Angelobacter sp.]
MKNWYLPVLVLGLSGVGLLFATEKGRERLIAFFDRMAKSEDPLGAFNQALDKQVENIQNALDRLSQALEHPQLRG